MLTWAYAPLPSEIGIHWELRVPLYVRRSAAQKKALKSFPVDFVPAITPHRRRIRNPQISASPANIFSLGEIQPFFLLRISIIRPRDSKQSLLKSDLSPGHQLRTLFQITLKHALGILQTRFWYLRNRSAYQNKWEKLKNASEWEQNSHFSTPSGGLYRYPPDRLGYLSLTRRIRRGESPYMLCNNNAKVDPVSFHIWEMPLANALPKRECTSKACVLSVREVWLVVFHLYKLLLEPLSVNGTLHMKTLM